MSEAGFYLLVLCHGEQRKKLLFEAIPDRSQSDSLELATEIEAAAESQVSMEEYLIFTRRRLHSGGYQLVEV